jgi:hypothetical protein
VRETMSGIPVTSGGEEQPTSSASGEPEAWLDWGVTEPAGFVPESSQVYQDPLWGPEVPWQAPGEFGKCQLLFHQCVRAVVDISWHFQVISPGLCETIWLVRLPGCPITPGLTAAGNPRGRAMPPLGCGRSSRGRPSRRRIPGRSPRCWGQCRFRYM